MSEATTNSATGRRKTAIAHVWMTEGTGQITINDKPFDEYLGTVQLQNVVLKPFQESSQVNKFDVRAVAKGGGINGQAGAISLAIARALTKVDAGNRALLKPEGLLTRDPRMKERKKAGQPGARKRFQFSKR